MTAGMNTQKLGSSRISLPRAGFGALLAATLLAGGLVGAAVYAGIGAATAQPAAVSMTLPRESIVVRDLRIAAGRGPLIGETDGAAVTGGTTTTNGPRSRRVPARPGSRQRFGRNHPRTGSRSAAVAGRASRPRSIDAAGHRVCRVRAPGGRMALLRVMLTARHAPDS